MFIDDSTGISVKLLLLLAKYVIFMIIYIFNLVIP